MAVGDKAKERRQAAELALWQAERDRVQSFISRVETFTGATNSDVPTLPLDLTEGEHALLVLPGVQLIEPRRLPGHFMGGNGGFTFHVARAARGAAQGETEPTSIDTGVITVTDRRAVFAGSLHLRTWDYASVIGFHNNPHPPWTAIAVSDRQKVSGVRYDATHAEEFRFALALGLARCHHAETSLLNDLLRQLDELERERPGGITSFDTPVAAPAPVPAAVAATTGSMAPAPMAPAAMTPAASGPSGPGPSATGYAPAAPDGGGPTGAPSTIQATPMTGAALPPPGWYPDPYRTARVRWWDGRAWTGHAAP